MSIGLLSLIPPALAVFLAFKTRNTIFSLFVSITLGVLIAGPVISNDGFKKNSPFDALSKLEDQGVVTASEMEEIKQAMQSTGSTISVSLLEKLDSNESNSNVASVLKGYKKTQNFSLYERLMNIPTLFKKSSDHIDHIKTQIPYALTSATVACICYLLVGIITI